MKKVMIIAGGTGGHIFPALAVADVLKQKGIDVHWLGSRFGLEQQLVEGRYPIYYLSVNRIRGKSILRKLLEPIRLVGAVIQARKLIKRYAPDVVLGMGGFASGPGGIAAWLTKTPLVIHEQNAVAGFTNRLLVKFSSLVLTGYPDAFKKSVNARFIGNPVRAVLSEIADPKARYADRNQALRVFVLGGSQGAHGVNMCMTDMLGFLTPDEPMEFWHQTGKQDYDVVCSRYCSAGIAARVDVFVDDMQAAYEWADVLVCRSGALTVAEIMAVGIPSILVPFPHAVDNHQYYNGKYIADREAAILIPQKELTPRKLYEQLTQFIHHRKLLVTMAEKAREAGHPNATNEVVALCLNLIS